MSSHWKMSKEDSKYSFIISHTFRSAWLTIHSPYDWYMNRRCNRRQMNAQIWIGHVLRRLNKALVGIVCFFNNVVTKSSGHPSTMAQNRYPMFPSRMSLQQFKIRTKGARKEHSLL
eukprot:759010_1